MTGSCSFVRGVLVAAGLAAAVAGTAALGGPAAGAQPIEPFIVGTITASISALKVQAFGTRATVTVTSSEPTALAFD